MRLFVDRVELEDVLTKAKSATEKKSALPVLNNFKLSAEEDRLIIYATDLENFLVLNLPARVEVPGETSANADKLDRKSTRLNSSH